MKENKTIGLITNWIRDKDILIKRIKTVYQMIRIKIWNIRKEKE